MVRWGVADDSVVGSGEDDGGGGHCRDDGDGRRGSDECRDRGVCELRGGEMCHGRLNGMRRREGRRRCRGSLRHRAC